MGNGDEVMLCQDQTRHKAKEAVFALEEYETRQL